MAKATQRKTGDSGSGNDAPDPSDRDAFLHWQRDKPRSWSVVIATRAALRVLPLSSGFPDQPDVMLRSLRAAAIARFAAKRLTHVTWGEADHVAKVAGRAAHGVVGVHAAGLVVSAYTARFARSAKGKQNRERYVNDLVRTAASAVTEAAVRAAADVKEAVRWDIHQLQIEAVEAKRLAQARLWFKLPPPNIASAWTGLAEALRKQGDHWSVWVDWYDHVLRGTRTREAEDAAFTDLPGVLPWDDGAEAVNVEIARRLKVFRPDSAPIAIEGIPSPIAISRMPDGRIGVEAGPFSLPTLPAPFALEDHSRVLTTCRNRAGQLMKSASSPRFQGRSEYAVVLASYLEWLPAKAGLGNILLADGEARVLNKLFTADEGILPTAFASQLSVLLEDHIALRPFYPELERHYQSVRTGRLIAPLPRDAVEAIRSVIHAQTPTVFDETVSPAIDEAAKPVPDIEPPAAEDRPPLDPARPKPPRDPVAEFDSQKSRSYVLASAFNRIFGLLQKGKDVVQTAESFKKAYDLLKPHIGPVIDFLRNWLGDGPGGPSPPPTIGV